MDRRILGIVGLLVFVAGLAWPGIARKSVGALPASPSSPAQERGASAPAAVDVESLTRDEVPSQIAVPGTFVEAKQWRDENGTNVYVAYKRYGARTEHEDNTVELYAKQYVVGKETRLVWDIYDFVSCESGLWSYGSWIQSVYRSWWGQSGRPEDARYRLCLRTGATDVTDLDADGETETTITYTKTCDESADTYALKVLMLEGNQKYGLRGRTLSRDDLLKTEAIDISDQYKLNQSDTDHNQWEGQYNTEANFDEAPPSFLPFAKSKWRAHRRTWKEAHVADDPVSSIDSTALRAVDVQPLSKDEVPPQVQYRGTFVQARRWTDQNGENILIVSKLNRISKSDFTSKVELFAKQVVMGDKTRQIWDVYDFREAWETAGGGVSCTPELSLVAGGIWVTDLNADGQTETTIAYAKWCKKMHPVGLKVLLMDGRRKYALRGETAGMPVRAAWFWLDRTAYTFNQARVDSVQQEKRPYSGRYKNESSFEASTPESCVTGVLPDLQFRQVQ